MSFVEDKFESQIGQLLYARLPAVYREQDNTTTDSQRKVVRTGDLARYLDACGLLLDRIRATLGQRLADSFPDNPASGLGCQEWLIPYFARLLDVRLVAPNLKGQRDEVMRAIRWRQAKGTLPAVEEMGEAVLENEAELQEGFRRVAITPVVGDPLLPPRVYGVARPLDERRVSEITRHPGLLVSTVDLRCRSRALITTTVSPAAKISRLGGVPHRWMQANPHGVPDQPGSFDDVSRRTVDLRTPSYRTGHAHPRRVLVHASIPYGLFPPPTNVATWPELQHSPLATWTFDPLRSELVVRNTSGRPLVVTDDVALSVSSPSATRVLIEGIFFRGSITMTSGRLELVRCLATGVEVTTPFYDSERPAFAASESLIGKLTVPAAFSHLERCTVRRGAVCGAIIANNTIFAADLSDGHGHQPLAGELRYSRYSPALLTLPLASTNPTAGWLDLHETCTTETPSFFASPSDDPSLPLEPDAAVLSPACHQKILEGANDDKELGVYGRGRVWPVVIRTAQTTACSASDYTLRDLVFEISLTIASGSQAPLRLERVALRALTVSSDAPDETAHEPFTLFARTVICDNITVAPGLARLEYVTVFGTIDASHLEASDCIFGGFPAGSALGDEDCIRYSRLPAAMLTSGGGSSSVRLPGCTAERPVFFHASFADAVAGRAGCGVLHPASASEVASGAEDGGELGAYHEHRYALSREAVADKLREHLPVGIEPVLIPDPRLHLVPATAVPDP